MAIGNCSQIADLRAAYCVLRYTHMGTGGFLTVQPLLIDRGAPPLQIYLSWGQRRLYLLMRVADLEIADCRLCVIPRHVPTVMSPLHI